MPSRIPQRETKTIISREQNMPEREDPQQAGAVELSKRQISGVVYVIGAVFILCGFGTAYYFYNKYSEVKNNPKVESQQEAEDLSRQVGKLIELPPGETPTIATVLDKEKIKDQKFFAHAENGDKLLAYTKAMKAILYRPSTNKIIEVAPIVLNNNTPTATADVTKQATATKVRVAYYNGTKKSGLTSTAEAILQAKFNNVSTVVKANASKDTYKQTVVVDVLGKFTEEAGVVAQALNGVVGTLPEGEAKPDADIIVILGE